MAEPLWPDVVAGQARRAPTAIAVSGAGAVLTYAQLDALSNQLARRLITAGVGPEHLVALVMDRSSALIVAMLAVAKSGGGHLPMDPSQPPDRLTFTLNDAAPTAIITDGTATFSPPTESRVIRLTADPAGNMAGESTRPVTDAERLGPLLPDHLGYAIYTSGSTGHPKGVLVTHRGVMTMVDQQIAHFVVRPESRVLQCASIGFDAAFSEIAMALCAGARLELAIAAELVPGPELAATVRRRAVSHLTITPSALAVLAPGDLPSVSTLVVAGEDCPPWLVDRWAAGRRMVNAYGPSETTVCATMSDPLTGGAPPIGRPLAGTRVEVVDERLRPVPIGAVGELCVGGEGVARGYLGRPGLTAERFVADPRGEPGGRVYRTGDLGYRDEFGALWFVGRDDDQVKIRGQRVDLGEVRVVLGDHPAVQDIRVVVRSDAYGGNQLAAYVVATETGQPPARLAGPLRMWARQRLPEAMVPTTIIVLDQWPLNANGKLDVDALPAPAPPSAEDTENDGGTTRLLSDLFADTLGLGTGMCAADSEFFDLGGHSLTGAVLLARIRAVFGVRLALPELALAPTPRALAERLRRSNSEKSSAGASRARRPGTGSTLGTADLLPLRARGRPGGNQNGDEAAPLFCLPPAAGLGWSYGRLLGAIAPEHPVYAIQLPPHDQPLDTMDAVVEHCLGLIRMTHPNGPYHLLGWSFGGVLAHAVAVALRRAGEQVDLLAVLDGYPGSGGTLAATGSADAEWDEPTVRRLLANSLGADEESWPDGMLAVLRMNIRSQRQHVPEVFDGRMTLFTAREADRTNAPNSALWRPYLTEEPDVVPVPADHNRMLAPESLAVVAPALADRLGGHADGTAEMASHPSYRVDGTSRVGPFDGPCHVLRNSAGQWCLWPADQAVPAGWRVELASREREQCLSYVEHSWTDPLLRGGTDDRIDV